MTAANTLTKTKSDSGSVLSVIFSLTTGLFICLEIYAIMTASHYKYDIVMCFVGLLLFYKWIPWLKISVKTYSLVAIFLISHALGVFKLYETFPFGIEYDYWVHLLFGLTCALVAIPAISAATDFSVSTIYIATITLVMGLAAVHELYEFAGALLLGEGEGVLFIGAGDLDPWDTQKDILNNLIGGLIGISVSYLARFRQK